MPAELTGKIKCLAIMPYERDTQSLRDILGKMAKELGVKLTSKDASGLAASNFDPMQVLDKIIGEILSVDLIIADISNLNYNIMYEIGLAHAMGKSVLFLIRANSEGMNKFPSDLRFNLAITYNLDERGLGLFQDHLRSFIKEFINAPRRFRPFNPVVSSSLFPYTIDLDKIEPREFENLCFELIAQMGFQKIDWGKEFKGIDVVATLPKKDPDGYEYQELWLISMGARISIENIYQLALLTNLDINKFFKEHKMHIDTKITFLVVSRTISKEEFFGSRYELDYTERVLRKRLGSSVRFRIWDSEYLTNLIRQYPHIAMKYFSEEGRIKSKYRKTPEEMYKENVLLAENLQSALNALAEEKKKRFIAERNAAWKDVAFKAAHKLGNPIDAIDTFLQSLTKRLQSHQIDVALRIADEMDISIEEAKRVIASFKSLTKAEEINQIAIDLMPILDHAIKLAEENGVLVVINKIEKSPKIMADPDRIAECFGELMANSLHWFNKEEKKISITVDKPNKKEISSILNTTSGYLRIRFEDNGIGVPIEDKEKIFAPFFTTYPHGTGLGLAMVKSIIENHGGQIIENGTPGEGASFEIFLPLAVKRRRG